MSSNDPKHRFGRKTRIILRLLVLGVATGLALWIANAVAKSAEKKPGYGALFYRSVEGELIDLNTARGLQIAIELMQPVPNAPRFRQRFKPNVSIKLSYNGMSGGDFDDDGCITMTFNSLGLRDREDVVGPQPEDRRQVFCIGDSTTVGWGVSMEASWLRLAENRLRADDDGIRLVNGGAAGNLLADEHLVLLRDNVPGLQIDAVLVTLCMNDLLPINGGMSHFDPQKQEERRSPPAWIESLQRVALGRALASAALLPDPLELDPDRPWVEELLALPIDQRPAESKDLGEALWADGVPQQSLLAMRDLCRERGIPFAVATWPFLQQLDSREVHPFTGMHDLVGEFCEKEGIPFLDLLDPFLGRDEPDLWVTPKDMHGNSKAHALAAPVIADFVKAQLLRD